HEGIYYFFEHADGKHTLVLADSSSAHSPAPGYEQVPFFPPGQKAPADFERIDDWRVAQEVRSGAFAHESFDFQVPRKNLLARSNAPKGHALAGLEVFDFQGDYIETGDGDSYARIRLEERQADYEIAQAIGNARGLTCGGLFTLKDHPRTDQNRNYLIRSASYQLQSDDYGSVDAAPAGPAYQCSLTAMDAKTHYRPPRSAPKPIVQGPQTAIVVGKAGEEIWTDKFGRVKVQFHWDRYGQSDETSSCWVRVAQVWAGKNWGGMMIPRIGQEVIVDFLEGDPDQPIITGRVYNGDQMPPWDLPASMTQSGLLTRSTKGGAYATANALRFEDKKGAEQVWLHAEKNQDIEVENDETHWIGHDRSKTIDHDETTHVKHDRTETVDHNETITIGVDRSEDVGKNETISIGENRTEDVGKNEAISIGKNRTTDIGENESRTVAKDETIEIGQHRKDTISKNVTIEIGEKRQTTVGKDDLLQVGKKFYLEAADEITLKTGSASLTLKKDGTIQLKGKDITVTGSGKIGVKASSDLVLKGSKIAEN
ncbi:MAG TPA: type VI secretion system tip protein TssI/VgrG, partial [Lamprocystis sp. (in: g-proteobacteria)]|nr:type VI secretion system tip protein TssI/VgrG [Lamprocystis sp. (in: g-proteobacteria)]